MGWRTDLPAAVACRRRDVGSRTMRRRGGLRERLVLGPIRGDLVPGEVIVAWTHASVPGTRVPGVLAVTETRCLLHVASLTTPDVATPLQDLARFDLDRHDPETVRVRLCLDDDEFVVELSLTNRLRSRSVGEVLTALDRRQVRAPDGFDTSATSPLAPVRRSLRHHARRVWVTVLGVAVLILSAIFASPFVPGPGALTAVAGIAILAREYEWARDLHVWAGVRRIGSCTG
ncbi:hypothetical protein FTX61_11825 [Nitriliruptoraceae bacterium ZYF776]|nr:hypothetical protein [Profundirhabdus halotolerans]